jgi:NAD(P)-dependent dehydrogenase (short-subunit alcohol dehydrogenase family)
VTDARHPEPLHRMARNAPAGPGHLTVVAGDVTDPVHRRALVAAAGQRGGLDLVVNNASTLGVAPLPHLAEYSLPALRQVLETNVVAPLALIQDALPLLRRSTRPRVVNVTSDASVEAYEGWGGYGLAKAALDHASAVLAVEEPALTVWAFDPGDMRTGMHQAAFPGEDISDRPRPESVVPRFVTLVASDRPSGRVRAVDVASTASGSADAGLTARAS